MNPTQLLRDWTQALNQNIALRNPSDGMKPFIYPAAKYPLKDRISISFSGGKTSAYMTKMLLDHFRKHEPWREILVTFANTGQEHEETLKFVDRCDKAFGFNVVWLEAVVNHGARKATGHRIVDFEAASRNGEPFEEVIKKYGIPNKSYNHCTRETKLQPMISYHESVGWKHGEYSVAIGIRADEQDRVSLKTMSKGGFYPCIDAGVTKEDVRLWWSQQDFNLNIPEHLSNCFTGDTRFLTPDGLVSLEDTQGQTLEVLTREGWRTARINNFDQQPTVELTVRRGAIEKTLRTTAGHRWVVSKYHNGNRKWLTEKTTSELRANDSIPLNWKDVTDVVIDTEGVRHGFSFGDGSLNLKWVRTYVAKCKEEILPYFGNPKLGKARVIEKLPIHYKTVPSGEETEAYLKGFVAGLIASDGHVCSTGIVISNAVEENVVKISHVLDCLGWPYNVSHTVRDTNYKKDASLYTICISAPVVPDDMILRSAHRANRPLKRTNPKGWKVVSIRATGVSENVFCATVIDGPEEFTLEGGILTRNCTWCWKKSLRKLMTLTQTHPEIFEFPRRMEREHAFGGGPRRDGGAKEPRIFFRESNSTESLFAKAAAGFTPFEDDRFIPFDDELDVGGACGDSCEIYSDTD
jgi:hypothetical protein